MSPAVTPDRIEDPTGVGDAFRGGFMKGIAMGATYRGVREAGQRGGHVLRSSTSAARRTPTRGHEFGKRYQQHFGALNGLVPGRAVYTETMIERGS